jgi:ElaB/YqjD/DUF883 family membrane-anchored ribosome-binding protein
MTNMDTQDTITREDYEKGFQDLRARLGRLQTDLSEVVNAIGAISNTGMEDLRGEASQRANALFRSGRRMGDTVSHGASRMEANFEDTLRSQPILTVAIATALGFALSQVLRHR